MFLVLKPIFVCHCGLPFFFAFCLLSQPLCVLSPVHLLQAPYGWACFFQIRSDSHCFLIRQFSSHMVISMIDRVGFRSSVLPRSDLSARHSGNYKGSASSLLPTLLEVEGVGCGGEWNLTCSVWLGHYCVICPTLASFTLLSPQPSFCL